MPNLPFTLSLSLLAACTSAYALPTVEIAIDPAVMRAEGPPALAALLAQYDAMPDSNARDALAERIDRVAAQRYATISRLYWYTDLDAAKAAAATANKPILELRLLGRLDEELSCANSRLFRETLYANAGVSKLLREHFILLWTTERPVPKVTIDFGDGRTIHTTTTGNSAHFLRDSRGEVVDVLPGVYAPVPFVAELNKSLAMIATLVPDPVQRRAQIRAYHSKRADQTIQIWKGIRSNMSAYVDVLKDKSVARTFVGFAQSQTVSKAYVEQPQLKFFGPEPGSIPEEETAALALAATRIWDLGTAPQLDRQSKTLVIALHQAGPIKSTTDELAALIPRFEQHLIADSALNELKLRTKVHAYFAASDKPITFEALDRYLYANVFGTPIADRWLGLLPRTDVTGLPGDGATAP
jgi:hypothetical protein